MLPYCATPREARLEVTQETRRPKTPFVPLPAWQGVGNKEKAAGLLAAVLITFQPSVTCHTRWAREGRGEADGGLGRRCSVLSGEEIGIRSWASVDLIGESLCLCYVSMFAL